MHLERLDLVGFKSFANRTTFQFEPGISVLCGPNGSGKSNVADAVRWALGEQSARAIRGRKGEDVIFVGSQGRQPLGLAEVSLTLDNADGRIPLDFDKVKITRRLYRSGEAEYLVNGSKVRLKDIHQWLLHAALDCEGYVVVGQGSVDELILQRADERRVVIDNAADIRRHQARLTETRSRLAATDENLLRCRAVIAELEPHVVRLRQQAERAERARTLREELTALAGRWFRHALAGARTDLERARHEADAARHDAEQRDAYLAALEADLRGAQAAERTADAEVGGLEPHLVTAQADVARLAQQAARLEERLESADEIEARLEAELGARRDRATTVAEERASLEQRRATAQAELSEVERAAPPDGAAERESEERVRTLEAEVNSLRRRLAGLEAEVRGATSAISEGRSRIERLERRRARLGEDVERLTDDLGRMREQAAAHVADADRCSAALTDVRRQRDALGAARETDRQALDRLRTEHHRLSGECQRLDIARTALVEQALGGRNGASATLLASGLGGVRGQLGAAFDVPERLRRAIGAALGATAQAILMDDRESLDAALELIRDLSRTALIAAAGKDEGACRAGTLEAADHSHADEATARACDRDVDASASVGPFKAAARPLLTDLTPLGFGDELVACAPDLIGVRARLLGRTVVVPDREAARVAVARLSRSREVGDGWQVVTLDGIAIRPTGEWWAGHDRAGERLVSHRREITQLDVERTAIAEPLAALERQLIDLETRSASGIAEERRVRERLTLAEAADRRAALASQATVAQAARLERELRDARAVGPALDVDLTRAARQLESAHMRLTEVERQHAEAATRLTTSEQALTEVRRRLDERRVTRASLRADVAARRAAIQGIEVLAARLDVDISEALRAIAASERSLAAERARRAEHAVQAGTLAEARRRAEETVIPLAAALGAARQRRQEAAAARVDLEQRAAELRSVVRSHRTLLEAASLAESRAIDRLERVRRDAQEYLEDLTGAGVDGAVQLHLGLIGPNGSTTPSISAACNDASTVSGNDPPRAAGDAGETATRSGGDTGRGNDGGSQAHVAADGGTGAATGEHVGTLVAEEEPDASFDAESARRRMAALRRELRNIGDVGEATLVEFRELRDRHAFLVEQVSDLDTVAGELRGVMDELTGMMRLAFEDAFARVNVAFGEYFGRLFAGGHAELILSRPDDVLQTGVDIVARPPGKRLQPLVSLSGGERALTMVALIFALLKTNPAPFCVLDEVDAALDESNVRRFTSVLDELSAHTQFIVVTHNRATMETARSLYGISMDTRGVSTVVSLRLPQEATALVTP
ncbi:MAG: AAA family ATPase [Chloroflexi bacterium]|nr:AAA family ATPase [Chloroflexota bacterium]